MRHVARGLLATAGAAGVAVMLAGCSGAGTPAAPPELASLRTLAGDLLTAVSLVKQWFPILYPAPTHGGKFEVLPSQPGDPPGSMRFRITLSDGTVIVGFQDQAGAGNEVARRPDGRERKMTWGAPQPGNPWTTQEIDQTFWDGTRMQYQIGVDLKSRVFDTYYRGTITRRHGQTMRFSHDRNLRRDLLVLSPNDGGQLTVRVPLKATQSAVYWPAFIRAATGTYADPQQSPFSFDLTGKPGPGWEKWRLKTTEGVVGEFTLGSRWAGVGQFAQAGDTLAAFRWDAGGTGTLEPVTGSAWTAVPSSAALAFAVGQWIHQEADLGPFPSY